MKDPVEYPAVLQTKLWDQTVVYPRYLFESVSMTKFSREFHSWWKKYYQYPGCKL